MTLRVGIIGAGNMGRTHAENLRHDPRVQVVGVSDVVAGKAEEMAASLDARPFPSVEALLEGGVDAVYVTTPNTRHVPATVAALERKIHVFCEKPMATSLDDARQVLRAVRASGAVYQVGHNRRFAPAYRYLKDQIEAGFIPYLANAKQNDGDWLNPPWITDLTLTGGFLYESTVHLLDMLRWLMGEVVSVQARARANVYDVLNDFAILLAFEQERYAVLSSSAHASWSFPFEHLEIVGDHAFVRSEELTRVVHSAGLEQPVRIHEYGQVPRPDLWGYREEDARFVSACLEGTPPAVGVDEAYKAIELCDACYRSAARGGETVTLPGQG
ncbi:MAG TPA: Gfo/Idh/MocA family oxidoreductase [Anaerolineae bacterium]|nr:Gfo/Idh/MocA family oxidoreductase [Anaerolineae bacterium]